MSSGSDNVERARSMLDDYRRGDIEALLVKMDPEVEVFSAPELPNGGTFRGREGYLEWIAPWLEAWEIFEVKEDSIEAIGADCVVMSVHQTGRGRGSGIEVEMPAFYMAEFRDGLATRFHFYGEREKAIQAAEAANAEAG